MRGDQLILSSQANGSAVEVTVAGDLDMAAAFQLETRIDAVLAEPGTQSVVLDLAEIGFIDSAGLGALLAVRERAQQSGIDLAITRVSDRVRRILDMTGLVDLAEGPRP